MPSNAMRSRGRWVVLDPRRPPVGTPPLDEWLAQLSDMHLAEPSRGLRIAQAAGVLPAKTVVFDSRRPSWTMHAHDDAWTRGVIG